MTLFGSRSRTTSSSTIVRVRAERIRDENPPKPTKKKRKSICRFNARSSSNSVGITAVAHGASRVTARNTLDCHETFYLSSAWITNHMGGHTVRIIDKGVAGWGGGRKWRRGYVILGAVRASRRVGAQRGLSRMRGRLQSRALPVQIDLEFEFQIGARYRRATTRRYSRQPPTTGRCY